MTKIQVDSNGKAIMLGGKVLEAVGGSPIISPLNVTPTTSAQTITASSGTDGYSPINVSAVTSNIDSNIKAGNIKKNVSILGVTGTYEGEIGIPREVSATGIYQRPASSCAFSLPSNATDVGPYALYYALNSPWSGGSGLESVNLSSLTAISGERAMEYAFWGYYSLSLVDLSNLITISGSAAMSHSFGSTRLSSVSFPSLTTISGSNAMYDTFSNNSTLSSVSFPSLTTISGISAMSSTFYGCTALTSVSFPSLTTISGSYAMGRTFDTCRYLTSLSFPALTSNSFGSYTNQFNQMLYRVTGCTVHFPSNLESVIGSWSDVTAGFGGTNTTVLFDLPATT